VSVCLFHKRLHDKSCGVGLSERAGHKGDLLFHPPKMLRKGGTWIIHCEDGCTVFFGRTTFFLTSKIKMKQKNNSILY